VSERYRVLRAGQNRYVVCRGDDLIMLAGRKRARDLVCLNERQPGAAELDAWLAWGEDEAQDYRGEMRRLKLRYPASCARCGQQLAAGERALWHPDDGTVLHPRQPCPL
jgi:glycine/D-amino acid oxidase-like deaminating enzyme